MTVFDVSWKDADAVSKSVCALDKSVHEDIAACIMSCKLSNRAWSRPWSLFLELSRKDICQAADLDDYFAGLADELYRSMLTTDCDADAPESIEISWPASKYEGVYKAVTFRPAFEDASAE